jgi:hypothetical protein
MIPLAVLLIPFALFAAGIIAYGLLTTWSLYRFGGDFQAYAATFLFWAGAATVLFAGWLTLAEINWSAPLLELSIFSTPAF